MIVSKSHPLFDVYSPFRNTIRLVAQIPLKARSTLIKQCQAQYDVLEPVPTPTPVLVQLLDNNPDLVLDTVLDGVVVVRVRNFFTFAGHTVCDPLQSAILLDILRGTPVDEIDRTTFIKQGWLKEIRLALGKARPEVNFTPFFQYCGDQQSPHPDIPYHFAALHRIRMRFRRAREQLLTSKPVFYPRSAHKNMSRSTRRSFEEHFGQGCLESIPIFGQDDWARVYEETGIMLEGETELRQKWYPREEFCYGPLLRVRIVLVDVPVVY